MGEANWPPVFASKRIGPRLLEAIVGAMHAKMVNIRIS